MDKQQALDWLVNNIKRWPRSIAEVSTDFDWDFFWTETESDMEEIVFAQEFSNKWLDFRNCITKSDWLEAKSKKG